jgi:hypothetical protein
MLFAAAFNAASHWTVAIAPVVTAGTRVSGLTAPTISTWRVGMSRR